MIDFGDPFLDIAIIVTIVVLIGVLVARNDYKKARSANPTERTESAAKPPYKPWP